MKKALAALGFWFFVTPGLAQDTPPDALVKNVTLEVVELITKEKGSRAKIVSVIEEKVLPHFNFTAMTALAVGQNWGKASPEQKKRLTEEFRTLLVRTYSTSLTAYRNQTIEVKPLKMAAADKEATVRTAVIQQGGPPIPIDYSMEKGDSGWKVYDVVIDGVSLVTTYRGSFTEQVQKGGIDGLVKTLADRNRSGQPAAPPKK